MTVHENRLARETSPYLRQHGNNPVDWYPWGPEALELAKSDDRPILLSIGYSACHWCHVMERESFESEEIAALMNQHFVNVKVDREERPDLDQLYQTAVQVLGGHGGWPLTVFLTPALEPFFGGTYFPPVPRHGLRSFPQILTAVADAWRSRREDVVRSADQLVDALAEVENGPGAGTAALSREENAQAGRSLLSRFDAEYGGFGDRPKFPNSLALELWLRQGSREGGADLTERVLFTVLRMIGGGIHDQIGGGFHRYSVDERWLVPHFEKMLYDNALLLRLFARLQRIRPEPVVADAAAGIVEWLQREMTSPEGGFFATQDADSEGEEGRFFVWDESELVEVLGAEDAALIARLMGVEPGGNFEHGKTVLHRAVSLEAAARLEDRSVAEAAQAWMRAKQLLFDARERRPKPHRDEKILAGWNGLMIHALAEAGRVFRKPEWVELAVRASDFAESSLRVDGRLNRVFIEGAARIHAFAEDHAFLSEGELALFEATGDAKHFERARRLVDEGIRLFADPDGGAFFLAPVDGEALLQRPRSVWDNAVPAATSSFLHGLLRLHALTGDGRYAEISDRVLVSLQPSATRQPFGFGHLLGAMDSAIAGVGVLVVSGSNADPQRQALLDVAVAVPDPDVLIVPWSDGGELPDALASLLEGKDVSVAAAYLCRNGTCSLPVHVPEEIPGLLAR